LCPSPNFIMSSLPVGLFVSRGDMGPLRRKNLARSLCYQTPGGRAGDQGRD
jgi:hypothetical protein